MHVKLSITPISLSKSFREDGMTLESFVDYCVGLELDGVDILHTSSYPWLWKEPKRELAALSGWLERSGLQLAAWATGNNFAKLDETQFNAQVDLVKHALREAADHGASILRIFGGYHQDSGGEAGVFTHNGLELVIRGIERCLSEAEQLGVVMALENHGGLPGHSYEMAAILDAFNSPWIQCMFDCGNFMGNGMDEPEDPLRAYENVRGRVAHVHVKDNGPSIINSRKLHGYVAGKGIVPLRQFAALLERDGYPGFCSLEYEASIMAPESYGVPASIEYLKSIRAIHRALKAQPKAG